MVHAALTGILVLLCAPVSAAAEPACSPDALAVSRDGATLYIGCATGNRVDVLDIVRRQVVRSLPVPGAVSGLALSADESRLYVTCAAPRSTVHVIQLAAQSGSRHWQAGHTAMAPSLSVDGKALYVCNRFDNEVELISTATGRGVSRIAMTREPVAQALTPDGKHLLVANALPSGRADVARVAAEISVVDTERRAVTAKIALPNGATGLRDIRISPDGRRAAVTHVLARFFVPATQVDRGWTQTNAVSILDVVAGKLAATFLLDEIDRGAANPWAAGWSSDGKCLAVTHAGTDELSVIDWSALEQKLARGPKDPADDLAFLVGIRQRVPLQGNGPRAMAVAGNRAYVAGYFSDTIEAVDLEGGPAKSTLLARLSQTAPTTVRQGEMLLNDGLLGFQGWLSCASCHGPDARVDGLNWDLLNDGIGNPKNVKSLLLAHRTPPAMSQGVREDAAEAVRAGIRYILFAERPDRDAAAIDEYLKSLQPVPSPWLVMGKASAAARRGRTLFFDAKVGCAVCHPASLFTNLKTYDVGTRARADSTPLFDTPTLVEIWRTAPYLHDGSAATLRDVVTASNRADRHGRTSHLTSRQIDDLVAYLLSL